MQNKHTLRILALTAAALLVGCGDDATGPTVDSVVVTPAVATIAPGATVQLSATVLDASGDVLTGLSVTWASDDENIATVDDDGLVTGVADGIVDISASAGGESATAEITVFTPVASVDVTPVADTVRAGFTINFTATPRSADGTPLPGRTVTWESSNDAVAMVDLPSGATTEVNGVDAGTAVITATSEGVDGTADVTVFVGVTGTWEGFMTTDGATQECGMAFSLTQATNGSITGAGDWTYGCNGPYTITGTAPAGNVVDLTFVWTPNPDCTWTFTTSTFSGTEGVGDGLTGTMNGCDMFAQNETSSFNRTSLEPAGSAAVAGRTGQPVGATPSRRSPGR